jgi:hypothetical protein
MFMGKPSVNRGKITSTDNTHPTSQNAKQIPDQHNAQNKRHIAERFSAGAQSDSFLQSGEWPLCKSGQAKTADIFIPVA